MFSPADNLTKRSLKQRRFAESCAVWIASSARSLSIVEESGFKEMMNQIAPRFNDSYINVVLRFLKKGEKAINVKVKILFSFVPYLARTTYARTDISGCGANR